MPRKQYVPTIRRKRKVTKVPARRPAVRRRYNRTARPMGSIGRSLNPFPKILNTRLVYKNPSAAITSSGLQSFNYLNVHLGSLYDFDITNVLGNKQPLHYDNLLSADGPYRHYKVNAWKTTFKLINLSDKPLMVYYDPASTTLLDVDTIVEVENRKGVISRMLTAQSNSKPMCTITKFSTLNSIFPKSINSSENFRGSYNINPSTQCYGTLFWKTIDGSTSAFSVAVQVTQVFYATLYESDSVISS